MTVTDTTRNQAAGQAGPSATGFYLSINTTIDAADTSLGSRSVPALAGLTFSSESTVLQVPAGMPTGAYYLLAKADAGAAVAESVETNNTRTGSLVRVGPDLTISALTAPAAAVPGGSVTVSDTMKNIGGGGAGVSITSFYLSTNLALDAADAFLGSRPAGSLGPAGTESASTVLTIPAGTPAAVYFLFAKADGGDAVAETQEGNNLKFTTSIAIGADLLPSSTLMPSIGGAGESFTIVETVKNNGTGPAAGSTAAFYLSVNAVLDASDVLLGTRAVPPLAAAGTHQATTALQVPAGTATGAYNVLVKVDANNDVVEVYETNNVVFRALRVGPDLTVTAGVVPNPVAAGATVTASDTVKNIGGGAALQSVARFYLSTNITLDAADVLLGSRTVAGLAAGASDAGQAVLTIPSQTAAGTYYVIAVADADNAVGETVEGNNIRLIAIRTTAAPVVIDRPGGDGVK